VKIPRRLRGYAYQTFYRLPGRVRRRIVRLIVPNFLVGAVTLITDSEAAAPGRLLLLRQPPGRVWGLPAGLLKRN
jgi:8-oxo-dGTP diphosphatase